MLPPTLAMRRLERAIAKFTAENDGVPPTTRELAAILGISAPAAWALVDRAVKRGRLTRGTPGQQRTLQLVTGD